MQCPQGEVMEEIQCIWQPGIRHGRVEPVGEGGIVGVPTRVPSMLKLGWESSL